MFTYPIGFLGAQVVAGGSTANYNTPLFDGINDYINLGNDASIQIGGGTSVTIAGWLYIDSAGNGTYRTIMRQDGGWYARLTNANKMYWKTYTSADLESTSAIPTDQWVHIMCTYDGSNLRYYENGVLTKTQASTGNMPADTSDVVIGMTSDLALEPFKGAMSLMMIATSTYGQTEADELQTPKQFADYSSDITDDSVYAGPLNTGVTGGTEYNDQSGNGNDGSLGGGNMLLDGPALEFTLP